LIALPLRLPWPRCGLRLTLTRLGTGAQVRFASAVACGDLLVIDVVQRDRLGQGEPLLLPPLTLQRLGDGGFVVLTAVVAQRRQRHRIALSRQDGAKNGPPSHPGDVADHLLPLEIHLGQRFLHGLDVLAGLGHQHAPRPQVTAPHAPLVWGPQGPRQQTKGMEPLQPLAVVHITLRSPRHLLHLLRIDPQHLKATCRQ
jgi:hypothetical protein